MATFSLGFGQYYPNNDGYNNGWYGNNDYDENYYFPDDYYYEYPDDYYADEYYRSVYNDYRRSISMVDWDRFFYENGLSSYQINMILDLNRQFDSYYTWNSYYRMNPIRWVYDRFYALRRILGTRVFIIFQDRYYNGYNPVNYYHRYWNDYYRPRYRVMPQYRTVNVNVYKIDRDYYHRSVGNRYGWNQPRNLHSGFRNDGFRNDSYNNKNSGFRNNGNANPSWQNQNSERRSNNGGFRNDNQIRRNQTENRIFETPRNQNPSVGRSGGFRNAETRNESRNSGNTSTFGRSNEGGFRGGNSGGRR